MSRVHIVCADADSDQVLARLARHLVQRAGWTSGSIPDPKATLNYFFPYILHAQKYRDFNATLTAAYFSHYDSNNPTKSGWWRESAQLADLRIVTAQQYGKRVRQYGPTVYVHAPVDEMFGLRERRPRATAQPVIGVSGMVYGDKRKGEDLVHLLFNATRNDWYWMASGRGWTIPKTQFYPWERLPDFYHNLDVFFCASRIEGVPMPPLEALACGVPVVIPRGVGMLDELPDIPGIVRYKAGDRAKAEEAVNTAIQQLPYLDRQTLHDAVADYSVERWVTDHIEAIEGLLEPDLEESYPGDWQGQAGVYMVAYGEPSRKCVQTAVTSWQQHNPGVPVAVVSEAKVGPEDIPIVYPDQDIGGRKAKISIYDLAPADWRYVLYLDADTETIAPVTLFFDLLQDGFEFVICKNPVRYHSTRHMSRPDSMEECEKTFEVIGNDNVMQLNGGVFAFRRNERVQRFFQYWLEEWNVYGKRDQAALLRALWRQPLRMFVLGNEWNTVTRYYDPSTSAGILHHPMTARRWTGVIHGRLDSREAWSRVTDK